MTPWLDLDLDTGFDSNRNVDVGLDLNVDLGFDTVASVIGINDGLSGSLGVHL